MVTLNYASDFGERLVQYMCARLLAIRWGYALNAPPIAGLPGTLNACSGKSYVAPVLRTEGTGFFCIASGRDMCDYFLSEDPRARVEIGGLCLQSAILKEIARGAGGWVAPEFRYLSPSRKTLTLAYHFRQPGQMRSGGKHLGIRRPEQVYHWPSVREILDIADAWKCDIIQVVTDRPKAEVWVDLGRRFKVDMVSEGPLENFRRIVSARNLMCAGTAFDWVGGVVSDSARRVLASDKEGSGPFPGFELEQKPTA